MKRDELDYLRIKALEYGIALNPAQIELFRCYLDELWDWNRRFNLVGLTTRERVVIELLLDSLIPGPFLPREGSMLDVGSGAGLPGLPLKILSPKFRTCLLEANSKRASFLKQVARLLGLDGIRVIRGRFEQVGNHLDPLGYDVITARAVVGLEKTIHWCAPHLVQGGMLVGFLGRHGEADIEESRPLWDKYGLTLHKVIPYFLPGKPSKRISALFKKSFDSSDLPGLPSFSAPG